MKKFLFIISMVCSFFAMADHCGKCNDKLEHDWFGCEAEGPTEESAVLSAMKIIVSQAYGVTPEFVNASLDMKGAETNMISRQATSDADYQVTANLERIAQSGSNPASPVDIQTNTLTGVISIKGCENMHATVVNDCSASFTLTGKMAKCSGRIKTWRLIGKEEHDGVVSVHIHARVVRPRKECTRTVMFMPVIATQNIRSAVFQLENQKRKSGAELCDEIGNLLLAALSGEGDFQMRTPASLGRAISIDDLNKLLVATDSAAKTELDTMGEMLTTDYLLLAEFKDVKYRHKLGLDSKTGKMAPNDMFTVKMFLKLIDVKNGGQSQTREVSVTLNNMDISRLSANDADVNLLDESISRIAKEVKKWAMELTSAK